MFFLILSVVLLNLIVILIPKRLSGIEILVTVLFSHALEVAADYIFDLMYNRYGYFAKGPEWGSFIYVYGIYPAINILFLNFFPYKRGLKRKIIYLTVWVLSAIIYERLFLWTGTFYYNGWKTWYSLLFYPGLFLTLVFFHKYSLFLVNRKNNC